MKRGYKRIHVHAGRRSVKTSKNIMQFDYPSHNILVALFFFFKTKNPKQLDLGKKDNTVRRNMKSMKGLKKDRLHHFILVVKPISIYKIMNTLLVTIWKKLEEWTVGQINASSQDLNLWRSNNDLNKCWVWSRKTNTLAVRKTRVVTNAQKYIHGKSSEIDYVLCNLKQPYQKL